MCIYFFFSFFFFQINVTCDSCIKCTFVLSIPMFYVYMHFIHVLYIYIYIYACISVYVCAYACVCVYVCVDPCVRTRLIHLFIAYHLCRVVTNYTYIVQGFFFFSFARLLLLEFASSDCIHLLSLKYMQRGCHGTPRAVHRIRGNTSRKFSFF